MTQDPDPAELVDGVADARLLDADPATVPVAIGRPQTVPPSHARGTLVGIGATLTGVTLLLGVALIVLGIVEAILGGGLAILALALGAGLAGTHWGWVHVAEATANAIDARREREIESRRRQWLEAIEPYARYDVQTSVAQDGSIVIVRTRHVPVPSGERKFTFVRELEHEETHSADEPAAVVAERAEVLRREAAIETESARERFEAAADAHRSALWGHDDDQERLEARRAASAALSEQINSNLRDPPLIE
jgi:hypothetical protein